MKRLSFWQCCYNLLISVTLFLLIVTCLMLCFGTFITIRKALGIYILYKAVSYACVQIIQTGIRNGRRG